MKTSSLDGRSSNLMLHLAAIICLLIILSAPICLSVQANETMENELAIIQVIHEGSHETVLIVNLTREKIDLCGYLLKAEKAEATFDFADDAECKATLAPLSVIRVHSGTGCSQYYPSWNDIFWTQRDLWDDESDKATLVDPDGNVVSSFSYGTDFQ